MISCTLSLLLLSFLVSSSVLSVSSQEAWGVFQKQSPREKRAEAVAKALAKTQTLATKRELVTEEAAQHFRGSGSRSHVQGAGGGAVSGGEKKSGGDGCFAGSETILLETGDYVSMENAQVGDRVQVAA